MLLQVRQEYALSYNFPISDLRLFYDLYKEIKIRNFKKDFKKKFFTMK